MNYAGVRPGDVLPAVAMLQRLLNFWGSDLKVDGYFGATTAGALRQFRDDFGLIQHRSMDRFTWERLAEGFRLPILDVIDATDMSLFFTEWVDLVRIKAGPVLTGSASGSVERAFNRIAEKMNTPLFLLRFHGHGLPGMASMGSGEDFDPDGHRTLDVYNMDYVRPLLIQLRGLFGPHGCVQFMHCYTGAGSAGYRFLSEVAAGLQVPVTAALQVQFGGGTRTFFYEGPTLTMVPNGGSVTTWAQAHGHPLPPRAHAPARAARISGCGPIGYSIRRICMR